MSKANDHILEAIRLNRFTIDFKKGIVISGKTKKPYRTSISVNGYETFALSIHKVRVTVFVHRIIWIAANGEIPDELQIDHRNRKRRDNKLSNLRMVTRSVNMKNRGKYKIKKKRLKVNE